MMVAHYACMPHMHIKALLICRLVFYFLVLICLWVSFAHREISPLFFQRYIYLDRDQREFQFLLLIFLFGNYIVFKYFCRVAILSQLTLIFEVEVFFCIKETPGTPTASSDIFISSSVFVLMFLT